MRTKYLFMPVFLLGLLIFCCVNLYAENIDPYEDDSQYGWGENIGWLNFEPNISEPNVGARVSSEGLTGFIWAENIGWINLSPSTYGGVVSEGSGILSGYAWGENVGWINFDSADLYGYNVKACRVNFEDLVNFVEDWLDYCPDDWPLK
jgi:hypothetical protein